MSDQINAMSREPTKTDAAASAACTQSGAFALALSMLLIALVPYWLQLPAENALGNYVIYRFELTVDLDRLDHDPFWQQYKSANPRTELTALGSLPGEVPYAPSGPNAIVRSPRNVQTSTLKPVSYNLEIPPGTSDQIAQVPVSPGCPGGPSLPKGAPLPNCPSPPTMVKGTALVPIPELSDIIDVLKDLNKPKLLTKSRDYSNFYGFSIERWAQRRSELIYQNAVHNMCTIQSVEDPKEATAPSNFVAEIEPGALLNCLSLRDVRELAVYEQPTINNPDQIGRGIQRPVDVGLGTLPRQVQPATAAAEALLIFALLYFGAFVREATNSDQFPAPGTLFGAFSRSIFTLYVMLIVLCIPTISTLLLAIVSRRWYLYFESALVVLGSGFAFAELLNASYFLRIAPHWRNRHKEVIPK